MTMVSGRVQSSRLVHRIGAFLNRYIMTKKKVALMHSFDAQSRSLLKKYNISAKC